MAAQRHFLLLFDLSFSRTKALVRAVAAARELLAGDLHPTDRVAVGVFGLAGGARVLVSFTSDRGQVAHVLDLLDLMLDRDLEKVELDQLAQHRPGDPLRLVAGDFKSVFADVGRAAGVEYTQPLITVDELLATDTLGGALHVGLLLSMDAAMKNELRERRRSEVESLVSGIGALARITRGIEGEKYLVYFSEGFESQLLDGHGVTMFLRELEKTFEELRRAGWVIHSVDPGGARDLDEEFGTRGGLVYLAQETGGEVYQNFNDLGEAMASLLDRSEVTYLLTFQTAEIPLDGAFHRLEVRLNGAPRGAKVEHRGGYYAPHRAVEQDATKRAFATANLLMSGEEGGELEVETLVVPFQNPQGHGSDVAVWLETDGARLLGKRYYGVLQTEVYVYAVDEAGNIRDFFTQQTGLDVAKSMEHLSKGDLRFYGGLRLDPGRYELRVLLRDVETGRYGLRGVPLQVRDFSGSETVLLDPVFFADPEDPSVVIREKQSGDAAVYPFRVGESPFFPTVRPVVAAGREARISLMGYHLDQALEVTAAVLRGDGEAVEHDRLVVAGKDYRGELGQVLLDFSTSGLAPGEYTLLVALEDPASATSLRRSLPFRLE